MVQQIKSIKDQGKLEQWLGQLKPGFMATSTGFNFQFCYRDQNLSIQYMENSIDANDGVPSDDKGIHVFEVASGLPDLKPETIKKSCLSIIAHIIENQCAVYQSLLIGLKERGVVDKTAETDLKMDEIANFILEKYN